MLRMVGGPGRRLLVGPLGSPTGAQWTTSITKQRRLLGKVRNCAASSTVDADYVVILAALCRRVERLL